MKCKVKSYEIHHMKNIPQKNDIDEKRVVKLRKWYQNNQENRLVDTKGEGICKRV